MANTKSAIKRMRQNDKRRLRNRYYKAQARTLVKKARAAMDEGELDPARLATLNAIKELDKAAEKKILHRNNAARRKGRLMKRLASLEKKSA